MGVLILQRLYGMTQVQSKSGPSREGLRPGLAMELRGAGHRLFNRQEKLQHVFDVMMLCSECCMDAGAAGQACS